jgi:hypothetical protein
VRTFLPALLLLLVGCGGGAGLAIHNGTAVTVQIEGLPGGALLVDAGKLHHVDGLKGALELKATPTTGGGEPHALSLPLPEPGTEHVWSIGGAACFVEGDYTEYYEAPLGVPATLSVVGMLRQGETRYSSEGKAVAGPGQRLPSNAPGGAVRAIVQVPCDMVPNPEVARAWLEMMLPEVAPN